MKRYVKFCIKKQVKLVKQNSLYAENRQQADSGQIKTEKEISKNIQLQHLEIGYYAETHPKVKKE